MRAWLLEHMNRAYVQVMLRIAKWTLITLFLALMALSAGYRFVLPRLIYEVRKQNNTQIVKDPDGTERVLYKDKAIPRSYRDELDGSAPVLIYENQVRSTREEDSKYSEDGPGQAGVKLRDSDRQQLIDISDRFLALWETFEPSTTAAEYRAALAPVVEPGRLEEVASRKDDYQSETIRPGGGVGSMWQFDGFTPRNDLVVRRFDGQTAYVTSWGEITTGGPSLVLSGKRFLRSYALILTQSRDGWRVSRAVAQTLNEIIDDDE